MAKKKEKKIYTEKELYDELSCKDYNMSEMNQYLKAKEEGFDIYDKNIEMTLEDLKAFRIFLTKNLKPTFTHEQLRELKIGFINKLNISEYANYEYSADEMRVYRKALKLNLPIDKIKECRTKEPSPEKSVQNIVHALKLGYNFDEIKDIPTSDLMYMCTKKEKDKIDILPFIKRGFNESQISTILSHNGANIHGEKLEDYVTPDFDSALINQLGYIHRIYKYEDIKNLFNKDMNVYTLLAIKNIMVMNKIPKQDIALIDKNCNSYKARILLMSDSKSKLTKEQKEIIKKSKCSGERYRFLSEYAPFSKENFNEKYFNNKYSDENIMYAFNSIECEKLDDSILDVIENLKLDERAINNFYSGAFYCPRHAFEVANYIDNKMPSYKISYIFDAITILYRHNLEVNNDDIKFLAKTINSQNDVKLIDTFCSHVNYKKINYNLGANQFSSDRAVKSFLIIKNATDEKTAFNLMSTTNTKLFTTIASFIKKGCNPEHLLLLNENSNMSVDMVVKLDQFNENNERKIDVEEIINLKASIREKGVLVSKLVSSDLDKNIEGYKMLNELTKHEDVIEQVIIK